MQIARALVKVRRQNEKKQGRRKERVRGPEKGKKKVYGDSFQHGPSSRKSAYDGRG